MNIEPKQRIRIKAGWDWAGRKGRCLAVVELAESDKVWIVVKWDDEDDPGNYEARGLEVIPDEDIRWPRPWNQSTFSIRDAKGRQVIHLGGAYEGVVILGKDADELAAIGSLIVEAVNKYSEKTK